MGVLYNEIVMGSHIPIKIHL